MRKTIGSFVAAMQVSDVSMVQGERIGGVGPELSELESLLLLLLEVECLMCLGNSISVEISSVFEECESSETDAGGASSSSSSSSFLVLLVGGEKGMLLVLCSDDVQVASRTSNTDSNVGNLVIVLKDIGFWLQVSIKISFTLLYEEKNERIVLNQYLIVCRHNIISYTVHPLLSKSRLTVP